MNFPKRILYVIMILTSALAQANVVGTDAQNFNPTTDGIDFVTVNSSETLKPGILNIGGFLNYAINTLPYFEADPQNRSSFNDSLLGSDLDVGLGLLKNWDIGLSYPAVLSQSVQNTSTPGGQFNKTGNTEIRPNTKVHVWGDSVWGVAVIGSINFNRIQNNPYSGVDGGPTYNLELAVDRKFGPISAAINLGHRWRTPGDQLTGVPIAPFHNQLIYSAAANYLIPRTDTKAIFEIFGSSPTQTSTTDEQRTQTSLEALLGIKHDFTTNLAFHAGFGTQIGQAIASPDWRVYTGLNYTFGPLWAHNDSPNLERVTSPTLAILNEEPAPKEEAFVAHNILFEFNSDILSGDFEKTLAELTEFVNQPPIFKKLTIEGHTDSVGSESYNLSLSQRRANAIRKYLIDHFSLPPSKVVAIGYGPTRPLADNGNYQGRQQNRRVEFKIDR